MKREEILLNCIDDIQSGKRSLEECVTLYPELAAELREFSRIVMAVQSEGVAPSSEFRRRARTRLLQVMNTPEARHNPAGMWLQSLLLRRVGYTFTIASLLVASSGITVYASQNSLPQDALYPVKTVTENIQVALTVSSEAKAKLHLKLAERRIQEVVTESAEGRTVSTSALEAAINQIDDAVQGVNNMPESKAKDLLVQLSQSTAERQADLEQISKEAPEESQPALKQAIDTMQRGNLIANVASENSALLSTNASVRDEKLESKYFQLEGTLLSIEGQTWTVGSIKLQNVNAPKSVPRVGSDVKLNGIVRGDQIFIGKLEWQDKALEGTKIEGIFSGTNSDSTEWKVGGVPVGKFQNEAPPAPDARIEVKGTAEKRSYTVLEDKTRDDNKSKSRSDESKPETSDSNKSDEKTKTSDNKSAENQSKTTDGRR